MATLQIKIKKNGRIVDNHCRKTLSKKANDSVRWIAMDSGTFTVTFPDGSPFEESTFPDISQGNSVASGPVRGTKYQTYKYVVTDAKGKVTDDPDILVDD
jgi:hypothetical protein